MQNQVIGRTRRNGWKQFAGTVVVMLLLLVGLMAQSKQANAQTYNALPDFTPIPEDMWTPIRFTPPSKQDLVNAVRACLKENPNFRANPDARVQLAKCILLKLAVKSIGNNCALVNQVIYGTNGDPCVLVQTNDYYCQECAGANYLCCLLTTGTKSWGSTCYLPYIDHLSECSF